MPRGWVYVVSNKAMPGLVKVGYSTKDPHLRALELDNTGAPHAYVVEYDALVPDAFELEQAAHDSLAQHREGKEWFRCTVGEAVRVIRSLAAGKLIVESDASLGRATELDSAWTSSREKEEFFSEVWRIVDERQDNARRYEERMRLYAWCPVCKTQFDRIKGRTNFFCIKCKRPFSQ